MSRSLHVNIYESCILQNLTLLYKSVICYFIIGHYGAFLQEEWDLLQRMSESLERCHFRGFTLRGNGMNSSLRGGLGILGVRRYSMFLWGGLCWVCFFSFFFLTVFQWYTQDTWWYPTTNSY